MLFRSPGYVTWSFDSLTKEFVRLSSKLQLVICLSIMRRFPTHALLALSLKLKRKLLFGIKTLEFIGLTVISQLGKMNQLFHLMESLLFRGVNNEPAGWRSYSIWDSSGQ